MLDSRAKARGLPNAKSWVYIERRGWGVPGAEVRGLPKAEVRMIFGANDRESSLILRR